MRDDAMHNVVFVSPDGTVTEPIEISPSLQKALDFSGMTVLDALAQGLKLLPTPMNILTHKIREHYDGPR